MAKGFNYGKLMQKAMCSFLADVLTQVAREGLPGKHYMFITFDTTHPGVDMAQSLRDRYPGDMMIVLQDWFEDLAVMKDRFSVTLNFGDVPETLVIPFLSVKTYVDPSVEFGIGFQPKDREPEAEEEHAPAPPTPIKARHHEGDVVRLDTFRKP